MIESARARQAWADYLALGDARSLEALLNRYQTAKAQGDSAPTTRLMTLADWSRHFGWQARLKKLADDAVAAVQTEYDARRREIMETGLAVTHERVAVLKDLLGEQLRDFEGKIWVDDVKLSATGAQVKVKRFNDEQLRQIRGLFDDLAKETGGRQAKVDITSGGEPIKGYIGINPEDV